MRLDEEHGYVEPAAGGELELGQQVRIVPNHVCLAVNLADELVALRDGEIVARWPVERGQVITPGRRKACPAVGGATRGT